MKQKWIYINVYHHNRTAKNRQVKTLVVLLIGFIFVKFIINGISGKWSLIFLFEDNWVILLGLIIGFFITNYIMNKKKK